MATMRLLGQLAQCLAFGPQGEEPRTLGWKGVFSIPAWLTFIDQLKNEVYEPMSLN